MATVSSFEELDVWKNARSLGKEIYIATAKNGFQKDFGLRDQLRRATVSIVSNIAEGFERSGNPEFVRFLYIAKGSAGEVRAQLYLALDLGYVDAARFQVLNESVVKVSRQLSALIKYLERTEAVQRIGRARRPVAQKNLQLSNI
jgi:four helix bundle protein